MKEVYFEVGDKVTSLLHGKGVVVKIEDKSSDPVVVKIDNLNFAFTFDGKHYVDDYTPTLFQGHLDLDTILPKNKPIPQFKSGDLVWVRDCDYEWYCRYFSHKIGNRFSCFEEQQKDGETSSWIECVPYDQRPF